MLLMFRVIPRPSRSYPSPSQLQRHVSIENARKLVSAEQRRRLIAFAMRYPSESKDNEMSENLRNLPAASPVLVYCYKSKLWEVPFKFVKVDSETVVLQLPTVTGFSGPLVSNHGLGVNKT